MNNKGQALVEFVLILPIFLFLIFAVYDFGMIFNSKNSLESDSTDIISLYKSGKSLEQIKLMYPNNKVSVLEVSDYYEIIVSTEIDLITPGFNRIFGDPYLIEVERYIPYE